MVPIFRFRVLVAVSPRVYESALVHVLGRAGVDDVSGGSDVGVGGHFDVAVLDRVRDDIDADVVLLVPGTADTGEEVIDLREAPGVTKVLGPDQLLDALDHLDRRSRPAPSSSASSADPTGPP